MYWRIQLTIKRSLVNLELENTSKRCDWPWSKISTFKVSMDMDMSVRLIFVSYT